MTDIIRGLFFDLDGTLCDTDQANFEAYSRAFSDEGYHITLTDFVAKAQGRHADVFIPLLALGVTSDSVERIRELKKTYYGEVMTFVKPNRELIDFLRIMTPSHVTVLVTTAQSANAKHVLRAARLDGLFDHYVFGDDVNNPKPNPEAYNKALALSGLTPSEVIAFEDSPAGISAAASAGIKVIKVTVQ